MEDLLWAIYFEGEAYSVTGDKIMGRQAAGNSLLKAYARSDFDTIATYTSSKDSFGQFNNLLRTFLKSNQTQKTVHIPWGSPQQSDKFGGIYYPAPDIAKLANQRFFYGHDNYNLVGITHTTASEHVINSLVESYTSPLMEWDAIICTSKSVKNTINVLYDQYFDILKNKIGATKKPQFSLPIIPLGVHADDYLFTDQEKINSRKDLNIGKDDIVLLFLGRLSFHAKAHHVPMYLALEEVAKKITGKQKIHLIQTGWFPNPTVEKIFKEDASRISPSITFHFLDGRKEDDKKLSFSASDIFISLVDNFQETFGLTPLEGMASNLPVIVSDWNGYKDTVRDNVDGFRIKSHSLGAGHGYENALRHNLGIDTYDHYIGKSSQTVAIDIKETIDKIILLINDKDLRNKLGNNARKRAEEFDWLKIIGLYKNLKIELEKKREKYKTGDNKEFYPPITIQDQYTYFSDYASESIDENTLITIDKTVNKLKLEEFSMFDSISFLKDIVPPINLIKKSLSIIENSDKCSIADLIHKLDTDNTIVYKIVIWLAKYGYIRILNNE